MYFAPSPYFNMRGSTPLPWLINQEIYAYVMYLSWILSALVCLKCLEYLDRDERDGKQV